MQSLDISFVLRSAQTSHEVSTFKTQLAYRAR